jgi:hypothetical protein
MRTPTSTEPERRRWRKNPAVGVLIFGGDPYDLVGRRFKLGLRFNY